MKVMKTLVRPLLVAAAIAALITGSAQAAPSCCARGNCCAAGVCCAMKGCCKTDKSCCDAAKGVCKSACGCLTMNCCQTGLKKPAAGRSAAKSAAKSAVKKPGRTIAGQTGTVSGH